MTDNATAVTYQLPDRKLGRDLMRVTEPGPGRRPVGRQA